MIKRILILFTILVMSLGFSMQAQAELQNLGMDSAGNRLIYDTDLDITWYDYTRTYDTWQDQVDWANTLSINFGGNTYTDWRLPTTVDGLYVYGYDGTTTAGYNITTSEMGHLYYTELGNEGWYDTSGKLTGCDTPSPYCLTNTGDFQNLQPGGYWSGTEYGADTVNAWLIDFRYGLQVTNGKDSSGYYAIAVLDGLAVAPEPISSTLFIVGGATLGIRRFRKRGSKWVVSRLRSSEK